MYSIKKVNDKNDNSNDHGQFYRFKEIHLVVYKIDTICKAKIF